MIFAQNSIDPTIIEDVCACVRAVLSYLLAGSSVIRNLGGTRCHNHDQDQIIQQKQSYSRVYPQFENLVKLSSAC